MGEKAERDPTEKELVERARRKKPGALEELFARYRGAALARIERKLTPDVRRKVDAEDVLQDVYLVAAQRIDKFEGPHEGSFGRWLLTITDFKVREYMRHYRDAAKRSVRNEMTRGARPETRQFRAHQTSPSQAAMRGELGEKAEQALAQLPPDYREIVRLVRFEGLDLKLAAERMGRSYEATKKLCQRALKRLEEILGTE